jgi:hypothetical protein
MYLIVMQKGDVFIRRHIRHHYHRQIADPLLSWEGLRRRDGIQVYSSKLLGHVPLVCGSTLGSQFCERRHRHRHLEEKRHIHALVLGKPFALGRIGREHVFGTREFLHG